MTRPAPAGGTVQSMTGFGRGVKSAPDASVTVDIRSTNHRYLEVDYRMPGGFAALQAQLTQMIRASLKRGRVEVVCNFQTSKNGGKHVHINEELAQRIVDLLHEMKNRYALQGAVTLDQVLTFPNIISMSEERIPPEQLVVHVVQAAELALNALLRAKQREGRLLVNDIRKQILALERHERAIKRRLPKALKEQRDQFKERLNVLLKPKGAASVPQLEELLALLKDADVNEEVVRIESHLEHMRHTLEGGGLVGKQVDFIAQELTRETNTLGAKVSDPVAARHVVAMKGCIEKIREQTQNLE